MSKNQAPSRWMATSQAVMPRRIERRHSAIAAALWAMLAGSGGGMLAAPVHAQASGAAASQAATRDYTIPAGDLRGALDALVAQSDISLLYAPELAHGRTTGGATGRLTPAEALGRLLRNSGLEFDAVDATTYVIRAGATAPLQAPRRNAPNARPPAEPEPMPKDLEQVTVTGTRIRGGTTPSPVVTIGIENIREEGFADLGEVIRSVPQNYSGGQNPGVLPFTISGAGSQNSNITGGSALNLRGLGQDASLTLLNGRRMAYGGVSQGVDMGAIPVEAVERIEIVADGASAIYGSDAVGGVANVILKQDFDGFMLGARYGTATDGGLSTREYNATAGHNWSTGGLIATFKDVSGDPIYARQRKYTEHLRDPWTLYPASDLSSALLSAHQSLGQLAELRLDAFRTKRTQRYSVFNDVGNQYVLATPDTTTSLVAPGIEFVLPGQWTLSMGATWAKNDHDQLQSTQRLATGVTTITDLCVCTEGRVYEVGAEGPLFALADGDARLAVGTGYRANDFLEYNFVTNTAAIQGKEGSRFAYAEIHLPLLGPGSSMRGLQRLEVTAALRGEDYDSFGRVSTPKLGLVYAPSADFTIKSSWGKSFKAPTLYQLLRSEQVALRLARASGGADLPADATVLFLDGGNPDLEPERARTWTATLALHPRSLPGLDAELTWFDIDYTDRVVQPITDPTRALSNPAYAEFVQRSPTETQKAAIIARDGDGVITNQVGAPYDPSKVAAIIYFHFRNAVEQRIRGLDLSGSYRFDVGPGRLVIRGAASWLDSTQRFSTAQVDLAGTLHNPPAFAGRLGAAWSQGVFTASAFANHKSGLTNTLSNTRTASFTTFDATLRWTVPEHGSAWAQWDIALSGQNLLDRAPPLHDTATVTPFLVPPYDATNYSAIGRFVNLSVSRRW